MATGKPDDPPPLTAEELDELYKRLHLISHEHAIRGIFEAGYAIGFIVGKKGKPLASPEESK